MMVVTHQLLRKVEYLGPVSDDTQFVRHKDKQRVLSYNKSFAKMNEKVRGIYKTNVKIKSIKN